MDITRYILIEDEPFACEEIVRMMTKLRPCYVMVGQAESVEQAVRLIGGTEADLIISDISLADGLCFEIFEQIETDLPVIFTTAYDEYAIKAFRVNGIDYLLKPVDEDELTRALCKFERNAAVMSASHAGVRRMAASYLESKRKARFLVQTGDTFRYVETRDIAFFYSEDKYTYLHLFSGRRYIIDYSLDRLEEQLDNGMFFRVARGGIVNIHAIDRCSRFFGGRLKLHLVAECPHDMFVSSSRSAEFLRWMEM